MKLNKVNKNGSLSIILPKSLTNNNGWQEGEEMTLLVATANSVVLSKDNVQKDTLDKILQDLKVPIESFSKLADNVDKESLRLLLKQYLLGVIERI